MDVLKWKAWIARYFSLSLSLSLSSLYDFFPSVDPQNKSRYGKRRWNFD